MHKPTAQLTIASTTICRQLILPNYYAVLSKERPERGRSRGPTEFTHDVTVNLDYESIHSPYWLAHHLCLSCSTSYARKTRRADGTYGDATTHNTSCNANADHYDTSTGHAYHYSANTNSHHFSRLYT